MNIPELSNGTSYYDGQNTVYYRGDGANTTVSIPERKMVERITPPQHLDQNPNLPDDVIFFVYAIPNGELLTITLRDAE